MAQKIVGVLALITAVKASNDRPIIGIYAQPKSSSNCPNGKTCEYIAASYVKFVESHGGRAVPISYYASNDTIDELFSSLNGVLMPGGGSTISSSAWRVYENAIAANDNGDSFPIWGTCNGFEWLVELGGGVLESGFDSENISLPLVMTDDAPTSRLFSSLDPSLYSMLQGNDTSAFNNHGAGITPEHFKSYSKLDATFSVLSTSFDRNGVEFVSTMEAYNYPFYGVQWHPEKNVWELGETSAGLPYENIPHTPDAISTTLYLADVLITESRKNDHKFPTETEESEALIWQYPIYYTAPEFVQEYIADF
jgi:gamma-glutamyl hydrolase